MITSDSKCQRCGDTTLRRDPLGRPLCPRCKLMQAGEYKAPVTLGARARNRAGRYAVKGAPRIVHTSTTFSGRVDPSKYVPGSVASPFLLQQVMRESRAAVRETGSRHDLVSQQAWLRRVSVEFHRRLRELGVPVEGAA